MDNIIIKRNISMIAMYYSWRDDDNDDGDDDDDDDDNVIMVTDDNRSTKIQAIRFSITIAAFGRIEMTFNLSWAKTRKMRKNNQEYNGLSVISFIIQYDRCIIKSLYVT
ncbi:hypothetical protein LOAG_11176 [Loa loa]|uniref:Uncharacterized protein n=1 Tax=Loa loa TaxID=7209 RepID=A0A1S0TNG9_LOALO|nr:hypothetical protein LOAG_11176 [Loa loa]EFO17322.1 hypothetical protein LOAG_11176 [Loa loa]